MRYAHNFQRFVPILGSLTGLNCKQWKETE
jgi:hypothetical protein